MSDSTEQPPTEQPAIRVTAMPADANFNGDIFGGWIMSWMDLAAGNTASAPQPAAAPSPWRSTPSASTIRCISATNCRSMPR